FFLPLPRALRDTTKPKATTATSVTATTDQSTRRFVMIAPSSRARRGALHSDDATRVRAAPRRCEPPPDAYGSLWACPGPRLADRRRRARDGCVYGRGSGRVAPPRLPAPRAAPT